MKEEKSVCEKCFKKNSIRFSWRWNDPVRKYAGSGRHIIHTGYMYICRKCMKRMLETALIGAV